jgi:hypothetical protein
MLWTLITLRIGTPILLASPAQKRRRNAVTETPTNQGKSSMVTGSSNSRSSDTWRDRLGRRFWMAKDPGHSQGNIAVPKQSCRQRKQRGTGMRRQHGSAAGECGEFR